MNRFAYAIISHGQMRFLAVSMIFTLWGFVVALIAMSGRRGVMSRSWYFVALQALSACGYVTIFGFLFVPQAMIADQLWALMLGMLLLQSLSGYANGTISHMRSVDAFGSGKGAWMGAVPLVNLVLLCIGPQEVDRTSGPAKKLHPGAAAAAGLGLFALGGVLINLAMGAVGDVLTGNVGTHGLSIDTLLKYQSLEDFLVRKAATITRHAVGKDETIVKADAEKSVLTFYSEILGLETISIPLRVQVSAALCASENIHPLFVAGATIKLVYLRPDGAEIGQIVVPPKLCLGG